MSEVITTKRLSKVARDFNLGLSTIVDYLKKKGHDISLNPNTKVSEEQYNLLLKEYSSEISVKKESEKISMRIAREKKETISIEDKDQKPAEADDSDNVETEQEFLVKDTATKKAVPEQPRVTQPAPEKEKEKAKAEPAVEKKPEPAKEKPAPVAEKPESTKPETTKPDDKEDDKHKTGVKIIGNIDLEALNQKTRPDKRDKRSKEEKPAKEAPAREEEKEVIPAAENKETPETTERGDIKEKEKEVPVTEKGKTSDVQAQGQSADTSKETGQKDIPVTEKPEDKPEKTVEEAKPEAAPEITSDKPADVPEKEKAEEPKPAEPSATEPTENKPAGEEFFRHEVRKLTGPTVVGRIDLPVKEKKKPVASSSDMERGKKKKRKRIRKDFPKTPADAKTTPPKEGMAQTASEQQKAKARKAKKRPVRNEISEEDVQKQIKDTLSRLTSKGSKSKGSKYRRDKRDQMSQKQLEESEQQELASKILKVTEFVTVNELATMMDVPVTDIISSCMSLGLFVSINQRLDAETISLVAEEYDFKTEFVSVDLQESITDSEEDDESLMTERPPIVTVMGHVDHGKTSLLDFIRHANVIAGEAGGITQHIGAYSVELDSGKTITFLDTPGHEAFTAMRARGARITDIAIIVIAADDSVMPQTVEAINHAHAAGVPIVFAINKIDKPGANTERIKQQLANMNFMTEDWGGKYQSQEISAKNGINIELLLEKVLLEAEILELRANAQKKAVGTVVESELDKGRGYITTILVQSGTLKMGDIVLAGTHYGHVKAMHNERGKPIREAGPATPALILGLNGAAQAGDNFNVMSTDREARDIANKREQLQREQGLRTQKHITLDEIGRRIAIGNFQELNVIVKGDVDGSIEALSDSLIKLSTEEIQVRIIHKAVGQISESDILLAAASNAIVVGFQVRPSMAARKLAEKEEIDIRLYSIIYDAINEIRSAMEGMLSPEIKEEVIATLEIRETFKIDKVGTVAGCFVKDGKIHRNTKIRLIRDGIVVHTGDLGSLKRFKDDVKEVNSGYECGLNIAGYNDIKVGDIIEGYREVEYKKTL
ncbi:MAG: translation initiation factor IF-2 [Bacteroidales bacterium]